MRELTSWLAAGAACLSAALLAAAPGAPAPAAAECDATFQPAEVQIRERPVRVNATLSEPVEQITDVVPQDGSGLEVRSVEPLDPEGHGSHADLEITFDTSGASAGEWQVTIEALSVTCDGVLAVVPGPE